MHHERRHGGSWMLLALHTEAYSAALHHLSDSDRTHVLSGIAVPSVSPATRGDESMYLPYQGRFTSRMRVRSAKVRKSLPPKTTPKAQRKCWSLCTRNCMKLRQLRSWSPQPVKGSEQSQAAETRLRPSKTARQTSLVSTSIAHRTPMCRHLPS